MYKLTSVFPDTTNQVWIKHSTPSVCGPTQLSNALKIRTLLKLHHKNALLSVVLFGNNLQIDKSRSCLASTDYGTLVKFGFPMLCWYGLHWKFGFAKIRWKFDFLNSFWEKRCTGGTDVQCIVAATLFGLTPIVSRGINASHRIVAAITTGFKTQITLCTPLPLTVQDNNTLIKTVSWYNISLHNIETFYLTNWW